MTYSVPNDKFGEPQQLTQENCIHYKILQKAQEALINDYNNIQQNREQIIESIVKNKARSPEDAKLFKQYESHKDKLNLMHILMIKGDHWKYMPNYAQCVKNCARELTPTPQIPQQLDTTPSYTRHLSAKVVKSNNKSEFASQFLY